MQRSAEGVANVLLMWFQSCGNLGMLPKPTRLCVSRLEGRVETDEQQGACRKKLKRI